MKTDLDTLATALYVRTDDLLKESPHQAPWRPVIGISPQVSDAELVTLAVMQALLGFTSEARWLRYAHIHLRGMFPRLPQQPGYNKRLRALAATMAWLIAVLARDTSVWSDDVWVADSTPVECGRSREATRRSELAGWAEYGYCASHSRYFWGLRLHLLTTLHGLPAGFALTGAKADERQVLLDILADPALSTGRAGQVIIADKHYDGQKGPVRPGPGAHADPLLIGGCMSAALLMAATGKAARRWRAAQLAGFAIAGGLAVDLIVCYWLQGFPATSSGSCGPSAR